MIDINIAATTGADLNHLVRNILKNEDIMFFRLKINKFETYQVKELLENQMKETFNH